MGKSKGVKFPQLWHPLSSECVAGAGVCSTLRRVSCVLRAAHTGRVLTQEASHLRLRSQLRLLSSDLGNTHTPRQHTHTDPSSVASELGPGQHIHTLSGRENMDTDTHTHRQRHTCTQPLSQNTAPPSTHTDPSSVAARAQTLGNTNTRAPSGRGEHGLLPAFLTLASLEGMCGPVGTWHGAARGQGRPAAGLWAPRRGGGAGRGRPWLGEELGLVMALNNPICRSGRWNF